MNSRPYVDMSDPAVRRLVTAAIARQRDTETARRINWPLLWVLGVEVALLGVLAIGARAAWQVMRGAL